jgi:LTXXQ motif family protein
MNKLLATASLTLGLGLGALTLSGAAAGAAGGMMGEGCPMMGMMGEGMMGKGRMGKGMMGQGMQPGAGMAAMAEKRLAMLKRDLKIDDGQQAAWNGYAEAVKARAAGMQDMHKTMMETMQKGGAMERLEAHIQGMEAMTEGMKTLKPAMAGLYAVLSAEQKTKADKALGMGCGAM